MGILLCCRACYVFNCAKSGEAEEICEVLARAREVHQDEQAIRQENPLIASSALVEEVTGPLAGSQLARATLTCKQPIGAGQFGEVFLATYTAPQMRRPSRVAVKMLRGGASQTDKDLFYLEAAIMQKLNHDGILALVRFFL